MKPPPRREHHRHPARTKVQDGTLEWPPQFPIDLAQKMLLAPSQKAARLNISMSEFSNNDTYIERATARIWRENKDIIGLIRPTEDEVKNASFAVLFDIVRAPAAYFPKEVVDRHHKKIERIEQEGPEYVRALFALASGRSPDSAWDEEGNGFSAEKKLGDVIVSGNRWIEDLCSVALEAKLYCNRHKEDNQRYGELASAVRQFSSEFHLKHDTLADAVGPYCSITEFSLSR